MTRSKCGLLLLLAAGVGACGGDPTESFRDAGDKIVTDPSVVFVDQGASVFVVAQLQDNQGNQLTTDFTTGNVGAAVSVVRDTTFLATTNGTSLKTRERFVVTGVAPGATSFEVTAGGITDTVPVKVLPTSLEATFSNAAPASNEPVVLSAAGYHFLPGATVVVGADSAFVVSTAEDGSSVTFLPVPGSTGPVTVSNVAIDFLPQTPLTLTTTTEVTVGPVSAMAGTNSPASAPAIALPAPGTTSALFDAGGFGSPVCGEANDGVPCQLYKLSLPADASLDATLKWSNTADLGLYVLSADGTTDAGQSCDALGNAGDGGHEACTLTLVAGEYLLAVVNFGPFYDPPDPAPDRIGLALTPAE
jgi:hypothetical protein